MVLFQAETTNVLIYVNPILAQIQLLIQTVTVTLATGKMSDSSLTQTPPSSPPGPALARASWVVVGGISLQGMGRSIGLPVQEL